MKKTIRKLNVIEAYQENEKMKMQETATTQTLYNMECLYGIRKLIPDNSIDLIVADCPYTLDTNNGIGSGAIENASYLKEIDYMCNGFDIRILDECVRVLKKINAFFFCSKAQIPMYIEYFSKLGANIQLLTWSKLNPPPLCCGKYLSDTEYIVYVYEDEIADKYTLITDHFITNKVNIKKSDPLYHPTKKDTAILSTLIESASKEGDIVMDMFAGSASTMVSCIETNRRFVGFEMMGKYYEIGMKRIEMALEEHPEYKFEPISLVSDTDVIFNDSEAMFNTIQDGEIDLAYFDVCGRGADIPYELMEKVIEKQKKPHLYVMTDMVQFPIVLMYFVKKDYKYDIITSHQQGCTKYIIFLRKGGVKVYGSYHTKRKFYEDDRDMSLPYQDNMPYELMERLIINSTLPGDTVFCSAGYGTSIEVCMQENRRYIAFEDNLDKLSYCLDMIEKTDISISDSDSLCVS